MFAMNEMQQKNRFRTVRVYQHPIFALSERIVSRHKIIILLLTIRYKIYTGKYWRYYLVNFARRLTYIFNVKELIQKSSANLADEGQG